MVLNRMPLNLCIKKLGHRSRLGETTINYLLLTEQEVCMGES